MVNTPDVDAQPYVTTVIKKNSKRLFEITHSDVPESRNVQTYTSGGECAKYEKWEKQSP